MGEKKKNCDMACSIKNNAHDIQFNNMAGIFFSNQPEQHKISEGKKKIFTETWRGKRKQ